MQSGITPNCQNHCLQVLGIPLEILYWICHPSLIQMNLSCWNPMCYLSHFLTQSWSVKKRNLIASLWSDGLEIGSGGKEYDGLCGTSEPAACRFVGGDMCSMGEHEVHLAGERDMCGWLGSSPPSFPTALTLTEPTLATVKSHVGCIAFSSVPCILLRISSWSTAITSQSLPSGGA